jgi:hypothetical protein
MILGLDVSTTSTGWAVLNDTGDFIEMGTNATLRNPPYKPDGVTMYDSVKG